MRRHVGMLVVVCAPTMLGAGGSPTTAGPPASPPITSAAFRVVRTVVKKDELAGRHRLRQRTRCCRGHDRTAALSLRLDPDHGVANCRQGRSWAAHPRHSRQPPEGWRGAARRDAPGEGLRRIVRRLPNRRVGIRIISPGRESCRGGGGVGHVCAVPREDRPCSRLSMAKSTRHCR